MSWNPTLWIFVAAFCCGPASAYVSALVGQKECLQGPSYWCQNFLTARECHANNHCIRTVWEHQQPPPDNGEICETCKKMVAQARDELKSNETQENIKLVLEGSCLILIPIKPLAHECIKLVDQAIPELIEALASQMNPQMVCSVAGLCNSISMDKLVALYSKPDKLTCDSCKAVAGMAETNLRSASRDQVLNSMLELCGKTGSFSDSCASTIIVYFHSVYENMMANANPEGVCHLAGVCHQRYHNHSKEAEVKEVVKLEGDMPCELCEQLVQHLRDILVANTTENEFEQVLLGICGQTRSFKKECVDMVETYYPVVYAFLTTELDGKVICTQFGLCPKSSLITPLYPLLPVEVASTLEKEPSSGLHRVPIASEGVVVQSSQVFMPLLPTDKLILSPQPQDEDLCQMCEYFLHFLQNELTNPVNEQTLIKKAEQACDGLPDKFSPICRSFVDTYAAAVIALLAQDIDPSQVCPKIGVCPGFPENIDECSPCKKTALNLAARVGKNTTEENIKKELLTLCLSLPFEESRHCSRVVALHYEDLTDMVIAQFTGDEMCFFMKYCKPSVEHSTGVNPASVEHSTGVNPENPIEIVGGNVETNEIPKPSSSNSDLCVLCEFVMKTLEKDLEDKKTKEEILKAVEHVCYVMPSTVRPKCKAFIDQYTDLIVELLAQSIDPKQICQMINICPSLLSLEAMHKSIGKCVVCESLMGALQGVMEDSDVQRDLNRQLELACLKLPLSMRRECRDMVRQLAPQIEVILEELPVGLLVCRRLQLCGVSQAVEMVGADRCKEGPNYWCLSTIHAATCEKIKHCQDEVWLSDKPNKKSNVRAKKFLF